MYLHRQSGWIYELIDNKWITGWVVECSGRMMKDMQRGRGLLYSLDIVGKVHGMHDGGVAQRQLVRGALGGPHFLQGRSERIDFQGTVMALSRNFVKEFSRIAFAERRRVPCTLPLRPWWQAAESRAWVVVTAAGIDERRASSVENPLAKHLSEKSITFCQIGFSELLLLWFLLLSWM